MKCKNFMCDSYVPDAEHGCEYHYGTIIINCRLRKIFNRIDRAKDTKNNQWRIEKERAKKKGYDGK